MNEIDTEDTADGAVIPPPPVDPTAWPSYIEQLLVKPFPDDYHDEFGVYELTPRCITVFLRVSGSFDDDQSHAYQDTIGERFATERDELAAVLDERWGTHYDSLDDDIPDFSVGLLEYLQAWPVYAWVHGDRVMLLGLQKSEKEHPFELCVGVARRWTDEPPADELLWPLFVRQLCERSSAAAGAAIVPLWQSREKPTLRRDWECLRAGFAEYREDLLDELEEVWGPPLAPLPNEEDPVTPALNELGGLSRESVDAWRRGDRLVMTGVTSEQDASFVLFVAVTPDRAAASATP
jgi:hypothetical protein